jgi:hypothetical protein
MIQLQTPNTRSRSTSLPTKKRFGWSVLALTFGCGSSALPPGQSEAPGTSDASADGAALDVTVINDSAADRAAIVPEAGTNKNDAGPIDAPSPPGEASPEPEGSVPDAGVDPGGDDASVVICMRAGDPCGDEAGSCCPGTGCLQKETSGFCVPLCSTDRECGSEMPGCCWQFTGFRACAPVNMCAEGGSD